MVNLWADRMVDEKVHMMAASWVDRMAERLDESMAVWRDKMLVAKKVNC